MTVLITREYEDCIELSNAIHTLGVDTFVEPMLNVVIGDPEPLDDYNRYDHLIFTSRNAVKYIMRCNYQTLLEKKCFVIGDSTENLLRTLGFKNIYNADSDIDQLIVTLKANSNDKNAIYFRGELISADIKKILTDLTACCDEKISYKVETPKSLSNELIKKISENNVKAIIFFSKNTAETFLSLCDQYSIAKSLEKITILTVSAKLKNTLSSFGEYMTISFDGNKNRLLELIESCYHQENIKE